MHIWRGVACPSCAGLRVERRVAGTASPGYALVELLVVAALVVTALTLARPWSGPIAERSRAIAAARYLGGRLAEARALAVRRSAYVAVRIDDGRAGTPLAVVADGNGNGVRTAEIADGTDLLLGEVRLSDLFPDVLFASGVDVAGEPVPLGRSVLLSFAPAGTASTGSIYLRGRDGSRIAVRLLGVTGRTRVLRYDPGAGVWLDVT